MAPEIAQAVPAVVAGSWEASLAERVAPHLTAHLPSKTHSEVIEDLLTRLKKEKESRERKGLNHWVEYAPRAVEKVLEEICREIARNRELEDFYYRVHTYALAFANAFHHNAEEAEDSVGDAYVRVLEGKTKPQHFFRTLKQIILNKLKRSKKEAQLFVSLDALLQMERFAEAGGQS